MAWSELLGLVTALLKNQKLEPSWLEFTHSEGVVAKQRVDIDIR